MAPLSDLRVVELGRNIPVGYCGRQFAAWGADVAMIEPATGAPLRDCAPFATDTAGKRHSLLWTYIAANKRAVSSTSLGSEGLHDLLSRADVFITDFGPDALAEYGVTLRQLAKAHPHLCIVSITPFGLSGPYAEFTGSELVVQALSGYLASNGNADMPPLRLPGHIGAYLAGVSGFVGALAAYYAKLRTGLGDLVEVSEMETLSAITPFLRIQYLGGDKVRSGGPDSGVRLFPCKDGYVSFMPLMPTEHPRLSEALEIPEGAIPVDLMVGQQDEIIARAFEFFSRYTRNKTMDEIFRAIEGRQIVCGKLHTPQDLIDHEQLRFRGFFRKLSHPDLGEVIFPGPPARLATGDIVAPGPAPRAFIAAAELGWKKRPAPPVGAAGCAPLQGIRVIDFTQAWIGPFATMMLGDLGAEVIKIESHKRPDVWRQASVNPAVIKVVEANRVNRSPNFNSVNRNKRDLTLDMSTEEGRALCRRLIASADIVAENYTPRVMERSFGLGYATLKEIKPDLIMFSSSGFGKTGPWSDYKTNGSAVEALAGWDFLHRYPGGEPVVMSFYQPDPITGMQMTALILISLIRRLGTGEGEFIDGSMLEAASGYIGEVLLDAALGGAPQGMGNRSADFAPNGAFRCAGEDRWIALSIADDAMWQRMLALPGIPATLHGVRFATNEARLAAQDTLEAAVNEWTAGQDAEELMLACQKVGIAAGVVRRLAEGVDDPHHRAREWFHTMTHPDMGTHQYNGFLWRLDNGELVLSHVPPRLGEHSEVLLRELLGLSEAAIADLKARDITGSVL